MMSLIQFLFFTFLSLAQSTSELESKLQSKPSDLTTRVKLALVYASEDKPAKVIELLNSYTDQLDNDTFLLLASSYAKKQSYADEVRVLNLLVNKDENNFRWRMLLAQAHLKQASQDAPPEQKDKLITLGILQLRRVLQLDAKFKPAFDLLLKTFLDQRNNGEARELLMEGITKFGRRPELFRELCRLDSQDGFLVQAVSNCSESIKVSPKYPDHYVYLVQALSDQKEDQRAERSITSAAKRFTKSEFVQWAAGTLYLRRKNYAVSARYFEAAIAAQPDSNRSHYGFAQALFESGAESRALEHFIKACKDNASTLDTFLAAGGKLKQRGDMELGTRYNQAANSCR